MWFLSLPFTSVDSGTNPTSDWRLACGLGFQSTTMIAWGFPIEVSSHILSPVHTSCECECEANVDVTKIATNIRSSCPLLDSLANIAAKGGL